MNDLLLKQFLFSKRQGIHWARQYARAGAVDGRQFQAHLQIGLNFFFGSRDGKHSAALTAVHQAATKRN